ncbi:hypothetical protein RHSIM_RhsimUnG0214800 [Rhododendron simsii]|uniref:Uncharacterized protein n=1 Tax=Rhododendron simsii TaxID=118357 RepID=A0A834FTS8_RHOSS|nr:hypothetical protein RHSIM_RhsimUnG0214800 [Rhododendron simsii]
MLPSWATFTGINSCSSYAVKRLRHEDRTSGPPVFDFFLRSRNTGWHTTTLLVTTYLDDGIVIEGISEVMDAGKQSAYSSANSSQTRSHRKRNRDTNAEESDIKDGGFFDEAFLARLCVFTFWEMENPEGEASSHPGQGDAAGGAAPIGAQAGARDIERLLAAITQQASKSGGDYKGGSRFQHLKGQSDFKQQSGQGREGKLRKEKWFKAVA